MSHTPPSHTPLSHIAEFGNMSDITTTMLPLDGLNVLLVEDDPDVREATLALMEAEGAQVTALDAAEPAIQVLAGGADAFDVLLTDVVLGGALTGFDVAAAALARHPGLGVVLATGYYMPAGRLPARLADSALLLMKPYRRSDLLATIAAACPARHIALA